MYFLILNIYAKEDEWVFYVRIIFYCVLIEFIIWIFPLISIFIDLVYIYRVLIL